MKEDRQGRAEALERLRVARVRQERASARYDAARGSPGELPAFTEVRAALEQFAAREAWLSWLDRDY
jgi:hypothetical protein